jgi:hypothetical protein
MTQQARVFLNSTIVIPVLYSTWYARLSLSL